MDRRRPSIWQFRSSAIRTTISLDRGFGFIRKWSATDAAAYEGRRLRDGLLDKTNAASSVWADTAYRSAANEDFMERNGFVSHVHRKRPKGRPMLEIAQPLQSIIDIEKSRLPSHRIISDPSVTMESERRRIGEVFRSIRLLALRSLPSRRGQAPRRTLRVALLSQARQLAEYLAALSNQCLDRRIPGQETLIREIAAWKKDRNKHHTKADWQFTPADARIKLKYLYPTF